MAFQPLQQIGDLVVDRMVVGRACLAAPAEEGIGLVEEQDPAQRFGLVEQQGQVPLCLSHPLRDHFRQIDPVHGRPWRLPSKHAVRVLPVPGGPWNSAR